MGSPISPAIANIYMADFEEKALTKAYLKPKLWLRYVDDTFVIWTHGRKELGSFVEYLNSIHESIKFTMELETNHSLPFLDVLVKRKTDGALAFDVFRKKTHTDRYLHATSHHHPAQIAGAANTLAYRSKVLTDDAHRDLEMKRLRKALQSNGYPEKTINKALSRDINNKTETVEDKSGFRGFAKLPYVRGTTERIGHILKSHLIQTTFVPSTKVGAALRSVKDKISNESHGVYEIPCKSCSKAYIGKTNRRVSARISEHKVDVKNKKTTSTLAMHTMTEGHLMDFDKARTIVSLDSEPKRIYREAIEIHKRVESLNTRDDSKRLPYAWQTVIEKKKDKKSENMKPQGAEGTSKKSPPLRKSKRIADRENQKRTGAPRSPDT